MVKQQHLAQTAVQLAEQLLKQSHREKTAVEDAQAQKISRMMVDPLGKELTIALVDQAFRSHKPNRIAEQLQYLLEKYGSPSYMAWWERSALTVGGVMSAYLPAMVIPPIVARLRHGDIKRYLAWRGRGFKQIFAGATGQRCVRLNLNQLGEAILGEEEAKRRLEAYLDLLGREDVEYISVKISSVYSQINLIAFDETVTQIKERLRILYRQAQAHLYVHPDGSQSAKFINLDMEEYRDLHLTVKAFQEVLDEDEFKTLKAGIVLQAYLPDSFAVQKTLTAWAQRRLQSGGASVKLRIVKGANLAMEKVEAAVHGWEQAPYYTKRDVDANYKRMVMFGCQPEHARAVQLGIASHNLFDVAYALLLRQQNEVEPFVEFEMLEGMANYQARAVQKRSGWSFALRPSGKNRGFSQRHCLFGASSG